MFTGIQPAGSWLRRYRSVTASVAAHVALLAVIVLHHPKPIDITPTWLAWGNAEHSYKITYLPPGENPAHEAKLFLPVVRGEEIKYAATGRSQEAESPNQSIISSMPRPTTESKIPRRDPRLGTVVDGPISGHEVHVAFPVVYPDPPVDRAEFPRDLVGDVVIEVTIDSEGNVVETRIVQAIGHGIDEKIEATLRRWHYQPATLDGMPVASHHDVHFHFPS